MRMKMERKDENCNQHRRILQRKRLVYNGGISTSGYSWKLETMWLKLCKALVTRYVLPTLPKFILVFVICAIIHQQLVAMLRGLVRSVYTTSKIVSLATFSLTYMSNVFLNLLAFSISSLTFDILSLTTDISGCSETITSSVFSSKQAILNMKCYVT